jgi:hypothetical protein
MSTGTGVTRTEPNTSLGSLKQIEAGVLNVGYAEAGPSDGPAVMLLHGWPYDIHTFAEASALLAAAGSRVIVPYLRRYGTTRFAPPRHCQRRTRSVAKAEVRFPGAWLKMHSSGRTPLGDGIQPRRALSGSLSVHARTGSVGSMSPSTS